MALGALAGMHEGKKNRNNDRRLAEKLADF
jgi:hypothetical protein